MINAIKQLFGFGTKEDYTQLLKEGALIVDVRTKEEYQSGHIKGSQNIPLNNISAHYSSLNKNKTIITCCASGMRSARAKRILKSNGYTKVHNGGSWISLQNIINQ